MKSLLIAGVLVVLFAWIHADKPGQTLPPESYNNEIYPDTIPNKDPAPMKKKKDSPARKLQFKDTSSMKKSRDTSNRKNIVDTSLRRQ